MKKELLDGHMAAIQSRFDQRSLELRVVQDARSAQRVLREVGKPGVHPLSEVSDEELQGGSAFWLAVERDGRAIACISAKVVDLTNRNFEDYMVNLCREKYSDGSALVDRVAQPLSESFAGRLIYFGGIEFSESERGNIRLVADFSHYVKLYSAATWPFDWMYTIIAHRHRKLADLYGFGWRIKNALHWRDPAPQGVENDHMILAVNRVQFEHDLGSAEPGQL